MNKELPAEYIYLLNQIRSNTEMLYKCSEDGEPDSRKDHYGSLISDYLEGYIKLLEKLIY